MDLPNLIIIDGLDECMDGTQVQILDMIFAIGKRSKFPFIFLVAGRPELDIFAAMGNGKIREGLTHSMTSDASCRINSTKSASLIPCDPICLRLGHRAKTLKPWCINLLGSLFMYPPLSNLSLHADVGPTTA